MTVDILSLAPELVYDIAARLDPLSKRNFRSVCQQICLAINPLVLSRLVVNLNEETFEQSLSLLQSCTTSSIHAAVCVRALVFRSLAPRNHSRFPQQSVISGVDGKWSYQRILQGPEPVPESTLVAVEKELVVNLPLVLQKFTNVESIDWATSFLDPAAIYTTMFNYMDSLSTLRNLTMDLYHGAPKILEMDGLLGLERLTVKNMYKLHRVYPVLPALSRMVTQNQSLTHLDIDCGYLMTSKDSPTLHGLFDATSRPITLKHLALRCWPVCLDEITLPHFRSLESIHLSHIAHIPEIGSTLTNIWTTFRNEQILLKRVHISLVDLNVSLVKYLTSYSGAVSLILDNGGTLRGRDLSSLDLQAESFFTEVLPKHENTLEELEILPQTISKWCFGKHNADDIARCTLLKKLSVVLEYGHEGEHHMDQKQLLLQKATAGLPYLTQLNFGGIDNFWT